MEMFVEQQECEECHAMPCSRNVPGLIILPTLGIQTTFRFHKKTRRWQVIQFEKVSHQDHCDTGNMSLYSVL